MNLKIQLLEKNLHDRDSFDCGLKPVNDFLQQQARRQMEQRVNRTWVLVDDPISTHAPIPVAGYFTLTQSTVARSELPFADDLKRFPMYPLPVIKLAWLGLDLSRQHTPERLGETLLLESLHTARHIVEQTGLGIAVVTDPLTEASERFFRKYGFMEMQRSFGARNTLFMPMKTLIRLS